MSLFKQKVDFNQFIADLIVFQFNFLEKNFDKLIALADESKVLTEKDKEEFLDKAHELIIADIALTCQENFYKNLSSEKIGKAVCLVYAQYLTGHKKVPKTLVEEKLEKVMKLFDSVTKAEETRKKQNEHYKGIGYQPPYNLNDTDKQRLYLCEGFSNYCAGENMESENWESKYLSSFKFAKAFSISDIVAQALNQFSVILPIS